MHRKGTYMSTILKGAPVVAAMNEANAARCAALREKGVVPTLAVVRVGAREDDLSYEKGVMSRCAKVGVEVKQFLLPADASQEELLRVIADINADAAIHGCLLFRPLPKQFDDRTIRAALSPEKDIDGITDGSLAGVFTNTAVGYPPCTAQACLEILKFYNIPLSGRRAVVVGRSLVVGNPEDPDRIFSSEVVFALSHAKRSQLFLNYFNPARTTFTFRMESDLISKAIFGGGAETGGYQDDYRNRVNWSTSGENRYFYKYTDMAQTGKIQNTMIPMLRLGEMYLIAAESQSDVLANGTSYVNTLRRNRGISTSLEALTPELLKYEYIRELYGEGQLFYLYKRLFSKVIWSYTDSRNPEPSTNLFVVPLPDSETENRE